MRLHATLLSLALGLTAAGLVFGEEPSTGNWFTHMFTPAPKAAPEPAKNEVKKSEVPPVLSERARRRAAEQAYNRRLDVILKLRDLADQLDDAKLRQDAEDLDQRNFDAYKSACGPVRVPDRNVVRAGENSTKETR